MTMVPEQVHVSRVLAILSDLAQKLSFSGHMLNERYLHHVFSHRFQAQDDLLRLTTKEPPTLHPEWPTYKKSTGLTKYGRYRREGGVYLPISDGRAGFIDFTIGEYNNPAIAIEFHLGFGWAHEAMVYNLVKLLDSKNPFQTGILFCAILRENQLAQKQGLINLEARLCRSYEQAVARLAASSGTCADRQLRFMVVEVDSKGCRRHWHLISPESGFVRGILAPMLIEGC